MTIMMISMVLGSQYYVQDYNSNVKSDLRKSLFLLIQEKTFLNQRKVLLLFDSMLVKLHFVHHRNHLCECTLSGFI